MHSPFGTMQAWVNCDMDHRPPPLLGGGMYKAYDLATLPPMGVLDAFRSAHTPRDITPQQQAMLEDTSPTACWFDAGAAQRPSKYRGGAHFYHDQQDCCVWSFEAGRVWANKPVRVCVARALPEFLSRMYVENLAWLLLHCPADYEAHCPPDSPMRGVAWRYVEHMRRHYPHARKRSPFDDILGI